MLMDRETAKSKTPIQNTWCDEADQLKDTVDSLPHTRISAFLVSVLLGSLANVPFKANVIELLNAIRG